MDIRTKELVMELTFDERAVWGECPACKAKHGQECHPEVGFPIGRTITGDLPKPGVHLGRLNNAPLKVKLEPLG